MNFIISEIWTETISGGYFFIFWLIGITGCAVGTYFVFSELNKIFSTPGHIGKATAAPLFVLSVLCLLGFIGVIAYNMLVGNGTVSGFNRRCIHILIATFVYLIIIFILLLMVGSTDTNKDINKSRQDKGRRYLYEDEKRNDAGF